MLLDGVRNETIGVSIGVGVPDLLDISDAGSQMADGKYKKISPYFIPRMLTNMAAGYVSIKYKLRGPNRSVSTACAAGAHSIGDAFDAVRLGRADGMLCGGSEASVTHIGLAGFCRMRALSTNYNHAPAKASRPFDKDRDGFVMGEGAGLLYIEALDVALRRNARIYCELAGYGMSGDGCHPTAPEEKGTGAEMAMEAALTDAALHCSLDCVHYVNAHATSTPIGDKAESAAICRLFESKRRSTNGWERLIVSSNKGSVGHLLGAAGAIEAAFTVMSLYNRLIPPNVNLESNDMPLMDGVEYAPQSSPIPLVASSPERNGRMAALSNSFGFGGTNVSLCFAQFIQ